MRVLVNFLVSWHKQCLEPSLVCPSWDHRSELDQWQFNGNWVITKSPNTHRVCSHISNRKEKQVSFFLSHFYSERELFWVFPKLPPGLSTAWSLEGKGVRSGLPALISTIWAAVSSSVEITLIGLAGFDQPVLRASVLACWTGPEEWGLSRDWHVSILPEALRSAETFLLNPQGR